MIRFPITKKGYVRLGQELKILKTEERNAIISAIAVAREQGDLSENAEYHAAKEKQGFIEARIRDLEDKVSRAEIIDVERFLNHSTVKFGATIRLADLSNDDEVMYRISGEYESDITKKIISVSSPLAKALIGKQIGDVVHVSTPRGDKEYEILEIKYVDFEI